MEGLFSDICREVALSSDRLIATHNAVVDQVYAVPMGAAQFNANKDRGEQRFYGDCASRLGGGGINFALVASSLGHPGSAFAGYMDRCARCMARRIKHEARLKLSIHPVVTGERRNVVVELLDGNLVFQGRSDLPDPGPLAERILSIGLSERDWIASCSFYPEITAPLLSLSRRFFLDSGYGYGRRDALMMGALLSEAARRSFDDFIIAANQTEMGNLCSEFGIRPGPLPLQARDLSEELSSKAGTRISILLHTAEFSTLASPLCEPWAVPAIQIFPRRRTNAGDSFAGAFLSAYDATGDPMLSAFFANAATAKRLSDDELPTPQNMADFLRRSRLKEAADCGAAVIGLGDLRPLIPGRESSVCLRASPGGEAPAPRIAK